MQFNRKPSNLPAVQATRALAIDAESPAAIVTIERPTKSVQRGILEIMLAFPAPGMADEDRRVVRDLYLEAVAGFPRAVVEWTLKYLVFNNPRNTASFTAPPTPQDVRDACSRTWADWRCGIREYYFEPPFDGSRWARPHAGMYDLNSEGSSDTRMKKKDLESRWMLNRQSPKPGEDGCIVPPGLQTAILNEEIQRLLRSIGETAELEKRGEAPQDSSTAVLLVMPDAALERLPTEAFPDGAKQAITEMRKARAERAQKRKEHEAYLNSLPELVRRVRWTVVDSPRNNGWSEDQIMAETKVRIEKIQCERSEAEATGDIYFGSRFDDGTEFTETRADRRRACFAQLDAQTPEQCEKIMAAKLEEFRKAGFDI